MRLLIILPILLISLNVNSQEYYQSVGLRGGLTSGLTYKKFLNEVKAMEATISFRYEGLQITAIRQFHDLTFYRHSDNFYFIHGYGGHIGIVDSKNKKFLFSTKNYDGVAPVIGLDAYLGIEYRADNYPFVIGIDFKPFIEFSISPPFDMEIFDFAFFVKYTF